MGTGEGAQAYGWGTYVTEVEGIGRKYAELGKRHGEHIRYDENELLGDVLDNEYYFDAVWRTWKTHLLSSSDVESLKRNIASVYIDGRAAGPHSKRRKEFERQKKELLADIDAGRIKVKLPRHLYTVEIPDNTGRNYLQWTEPLPESIDTNKMAEAFLVRVVEGKSDETEIEMLVRDVRDSFDEVRDGKGLYKAIALFVGEQGASEFLSSVGFSGIEYPAQYTTGGRVDGARNYVIFNDADVQIIDHLRFRNRAEIVAPKSLQESKMAAATQLANMLNVQVRVIRDVTEIEADDSNRSIISSIREASGWYDRITGEIAVILPNCADIAEVQQTILHEAVGHYGLSELLGQERADELSRRVFASLDSATQRALMKRYGSETVAGDEYLAKLAEGNVALGAFRRTIAVVRDFLREILNIDLKMTDTDMQYLILQSRRNLERRHIAEEEIDEKRTIRFRPAFHGSPHDFEQFDHSFMGTGEGAQAYGWGTYVTEVEGIARSYAEGLTDDALGEIAGKPVGRYLRKKMTEGMTFDAAKADFLGRFDEGRLRKSPELYGETLRVLDKVRNLEETDLYNRHLYTVEIPNNTGKNYLRWDEPLPVSVDTSQMMKPLLDWCQNNIFEDAELERVCHNIQDSFEKIQTGKDLYKTISYYWGGDQGASEFLATFGFSGIEYPAEHTTGGRVDKAKNYVVFNADDVRISDHIRYREMKQTQPKGKGCSCTLEKLRQESRLSQANASKINKVRHKI